MSLFVCQQCGCLENTALCRFWSRMVGGDGRALCSACDPRIGEWHGAFDKRTYDPDRDHPHWIDGEWVDSHLP